MIYLIPKCFKKKKDFIKTCFKYLDGIENLDIEFNPKKSIYPRLKQSKKRGKNALIEILNSLFICSFSDLDQPMKDLINTLKWNLKKKEINGIQILTIKFANSELLAQSYFPLNEWNHISETDSDLLNSKIMIMADMIFQKDEDKEKEIDTVQIITSHLSNYIINTNEKLEIIKYILNN